MFTKRGAEIGLDIGSKAVKAIRVKDTPHGLSLQGWLEEQGGEDPKKVPLSQLIGRLVGRSGWPVKKAVLVMGGPPLIVTNLNVPLMSEKELAVAVRWRVEEHLHLSLENYLISYLHQGQKETLSGKQTNLLVAAVPAADFASKLESIKRGGWQVVGTNILPLALGEVAASSGQLKPTETKIIVHWGAEFASFSFFEGYHLQFCRDIPLGAESLTSVLSHDLGMPLGEAEDLKRKQGIPLEGEEAGRIMGIMRPPLEQLVAEIKRSIGYYQKQKDGQEIKEVILSGGGALLKNLPDYLSRSLGFPVEVIKPLTNLSLHSLPEEEKRQFLAAAPAFAPALGLFTSFGPALNFLAVLKKQNHQVARKGLWGRVLLPSLLVLFLIAPLFFQLGINHLQGKLARAGQAQEKLVGLESELRGLNEERQDLKKREGLIRHTLEQQIPLHLYLKEISRLVPENVLLKRLDFQGGDIYFEGYIPGAPVTAQQVLSQFLSSLEKSSYFQKCGQITTNVIPPPKGGLDFSFRSTLALHPTKEQI